MAPFEDAQGYVISSDYGQPVHAFLRQTLARADSTLAEAVPLLHGGSVKPDNAAALFAMLDIDGGLIGSAALEAGSLLSIYHAVP
ncbi:triose-phosphate isomerase [Pseudogulbenkiania subflava]|uniref:triose-phosphate isomerase n=1 Tax=Pseudogulbenkiania subflava TaxID=451637 RepID=UPI00190E7C68|nr:triose-phosphate isomerase [Pseudogulbenkiania subflava]